MSKPNIFRLFFLLFGILFNFFQFDIADGLIFKRFATIPVPPSKLIKSETLCTLFSMKEP